MDLAKENRMVRVEHGWVGIDAGKGHHHVVVIDQEGGLCCRAESPTTNRT